MMKHPLKHEIYQVDKSFEANIEAGPQFTGELPKIPTLNQKYKLWNWEINSPLGIPAGPLFNSDWVKFYAQFGFDVLVYKTVRSVEKKCNPWPNCLYVDSMEQLSSAGEIKPEIFTTKRPEFVEDITITNSFGVPAFPPSQWLSDIEVAQRSLKKGQVMITSITGTSGISERDLFTDFAYTASMAKEAGAVIIEANYSCPNLCGGKEGELYTDPAASAEVSKKMRMAVGRSIPLMIKIGNLPYDLLKSVVKANLPYIDGFAGINTIPAHVRTPEGEQALPGEGRLQSGICGAGIRHESLSFTKNLYQIRRELGANFLICGVGGIMSVQDFNDRLDAGADIAMSATAVMWEPYLAVNWKKTQLS